MLSITIIALGPVILAAVMATALLRRRHQRETNSLYNGAARLIVASAALATVLVTIGVLIFRR